MKQINRLIAFALIGITAAFLACSDPELPTANIGSSGAGGFKANFTFANATADVPSLDLYVNGISIGTALSGGSIPAYAVVPIVSSGAAGSATANTSIRAKGTAAPIGGLIGTSDLIYRSGGNAINNFAALNAASYTIIAIDSISRPVPLRTSRVAFSVPSDVNSPKIVSADVTYWNPNILKQISASRRDSLNPANCPRCLNWDAALNGGLGAQSASTQVEYNNLVAVGTGAAGIVPLGITDPGGVRFVTITDVLLTFPTTATTNAGIRFLNCVANANGVTAAPNANGSAAGPPIFVRITPGPTPPSSTTTFIANSANFNPSVGSRTGAAAVFTSVAIAIAGVPNALTLQVATDAGYVNIIYSTPISFFPGKNYTVFIRGIVGKTGAKGVSHGIITH